MRVLVLQHIACEPPGVFEDVLRERGHELVRVELDEGDPLPGGRIRRDRGHGRADERQRRVEHPWLVAEKEAIARHVRGGKPFWGSCLGAQLLAAALGARVYAGPAPEVGVLGIELTPRASADPVLGGLPAAIDTLQWHGDTFDLPEGGVLLASLARLREPGLPGRAGRLRRAVPRRGDRGDGGGVGGGARLRGVRRPRARTGRQ